ncbi:hypothetical protein [Brachybacterium aquaticum]|uniref:Uncharacterized protein n=1 Tax=Brachybacterium aquaticum TaxID=1432564 RepID=A0A841AE95_9MICO|nr:hypothetical protein [Brachybacterium aquaticum]MBB5833146.1 hypothetical protein [Brachybacterium aquaticum]
MTEATTSTSDGSAADRSASPHRIPALPTVGATTPVHPTPLDRAVRLAVGALGHLPEPVLRAVAGAPVVRDDQHLETEVQAGLRMLSALPEESF